MRSLGVKIFIGFLIIFGFVLIVLRYKSQIKPVCHGCNTILISIDTLRPDHLGVYGYNKKISPNLDRESKYGLVFDNAYSTAPWTLPSHAALLTSKYPHELGVQYITDKIPQNSYTLEDHLKKYGYLTAGFSGGTFISEKYGFNKGFDFFEAREGLWKDADYVFSRARDFLEKNKKRKFFLFLHTFEVHYPYRPPQDISKELDPLYKGSLNSVEKEFIADLNSKKISVSHEDLERIVSLYDGEIRNLDSYLKGLFDQIQSLGLKEKTIVVLTSDHGEEFGERGFWGIHAYSLHNELLHIPLIVFSPGLKPREIKTPVSNIDIAPSILDLLGIQIPEEFEGNSFLSHNYQKPIFSETQIARDVFTKTEWAHANMMSIFPTEVNNTSLEKTTISVISWPYKLIKHPGQSYELYDMSQDPGEKKNIEVIKQDKKQALLKLISEYVLKNQENKSIKNANGSIDMNNFGY